MKKPLFYIVLLSIIIGSCTKEIVIVPPNYQEKLVVHSYLNSDSFVQVSVSKSLPISSKESFQAVTNAVINIYEGGLLRGTLVHIIDGTYEIGFKPIKGKEYFIEVVAGDLRCTALDVVPDEVEIETIKVDTIPFFKGQDFLQFTLTPSNDLGLKDYYEISALFKVREYVVTMGVLDSFDVLRKVNLSTIDPIILSNTNNDNFVNQFLFEDEKMSAGTKIKVGTYDVKNLEPNLTPVSITLILKKMSFLGYDYFNTLYNHNYYRSDPFSLPVKVHTNIENGYGFFGGTQEDRIEIVF